jgi:hypothetical protein
MDNSLPLWIQDALLLASAVLVWLYVRATNKLVEIGQHQIEKTNLLAEAAQRQTAAAEGQLAILRAQLEDEEREGLAALKRTLFELKHAAMHWAGRMSDMGALPRQAEEFKLLPSEWPVAIEHGRKFAPVLYTNLCGLQLKANEASLLFGQFLARGELFRGREVDPLKSLFSQIADVSAQCITNVGSIEDQKKRS